MWPLYVELLAGKLPSALYVGAVTSVNVLIVLGSKVNVIVLPDDVISTPLDWAKVVTNAALLSETTFPLGVLICDTVNPVDTVESIVIVKVFPLVLVLTPVPPAIFTDADELEEAMVPLSPSIVFINGFETCTASANVATLTLLDTADPDVFVVTTSKSAFAKLLAAVSSVNFGIV